jgi:hypothetical protein
MVAPLVSFSVLKASFLQLSLPCSGDPGKPYIEDYRISRWRHFQHHFPSLGHHYQSTFWLEGSKVERCCIYHINGDECRGHDIAEAWHLDTCWSMHAGWWRCPQGWKKR